MFAFLKVYTVISLPTHPYPFSSTSKVTFSNIYLNLYIKQKTYIWLFCLINNLYLYIKQKDLNSITVLFVNNNEGRTPHKKSRAL